ncbi:hypothetical protein N7466_011136 [Penicillium verhagenii]|uniref:uncharacterized protein n=1 Tax=Penicillium verhagenii TaxID=1562060 RepID=UPI002544F937|nr:uncharacterized protein N7466_011136 [Penicillium verhagenii]KAJ5917582.1 hypothetical protein N7466_011136 [Penicillium verhagenii]
MDQTEILHTISTLNGHWVRAERRVAKYQQELATVRQSLAQTNSEMEEIVKVAEILYETNRRMGAVMDYLLEQEALKESGEEPKSFDAMFGWVVAQVEQSSNAEAKDGAVAAGEAAAGASRLVAMSNASM